MSPETASSPVPESSPEPGPALTPVAEDYLKVVWSAQEWSDEPVTTKALAARLGVGASTVSETVRRLAAQGLLVHERYGKVTLTDAGRAQALRMVRRHRLLETFLVAQLGYGWDEVHDEAEVLEHAVSDTFLDRLDRALGHPTRDPHGDPIPAADGTVATPDARPLADLPPRTGGRVARISDADPDVLRYLVTQDVVLDSVVTLHAVNAAAGVVTLTVDDASTPQDLGLGAAQAVWVVPDTTTEPQENP
ncbi:DtxR family transcriptional regulator [Flavimobilis marinus]|uniref:Manganese transport regulator n=1 Tax=Flavimobilis marinus TaxID=285351 RepID=A0A1I2G093_9MICO|nr:metal-dependent transcriptional regulator [Flavimobilis marinus]GHG50804.1 DtxR family transcriptional regulator [Flavimobilis marinus]SFF10051.1 iron (metal) dependent repressor, DtxR family [Flavimobilis marinus]